MRKFLRVFTLTCSMAVAPFAVAGDRTIYFTVDNMTCVTCPYIVKTSMASVPGVINVAVSFETKTATVTFDDSKTDPGAIAAASTNAGYPAHLAQQVN